METQILKLEYENSQFKNNQGQPEPKKNPATKTFNSSLESSSEKGSEEKRKRVGKSESHLISIVEPEKLSVEVEEIINDIKNEPIENVLKRREYQYKARKPDPKQVREGNKYLRELANIEKDYAKTMKKPTLVIRLDDADF